MELVPHPVYSNGSCIGGINLPSTWDPITIFDGDVYGFKQTNSGKRGLICIRETYYLSSTEPDPGIPYFARVDIIIEH